MRVSLRRSTAAAALVWAASACAAPIDTSRAPSPARDAGPRAPTEFPAARAGLLVMAHGAGSPWNDRVGDAVASLRDRMPVAVAFGMADPRSLQAALDSLRDHGVSDVAVVRLFVSGASFLHPTEYLFGLRSDPPDRAFLGHRMVGGDEIAPLRTEARILLDGEGLAGSGEAKAILLARAAAHADVPEETGVALIAHGMGDDDENRAVLLAMDDAATALRARGYAEVRVGALREDWAAPREAAERDIRAAVERMANAHGRVVVVPYRVFGFGPYADVLDGLDYVATDGFLPHDLVTDWIARRATSQLCRAGVPSPLGSCDLHADLDSSARGSR